MATHMQHNSRGQLNANRLYISCKLDLEELILLATPGMLLEVYLLEATGNCNKVTGHGLLCFWDATKAFDLVKHSALLRRLVESSKYLIVSSFLARFWKCDSWQHNIVGIYFQQYYLDINFVPGNTSNVICGSSSSFNPNSCQPLPLVLMILKPQ